METNPTDITLQTCKNCGTEFPHLFCSQCGQKTKKNEARSAKDLVKQYFVHLWHEAEIFFFTTREIILRPGTVISEYLAGKEKKYYNPFNYFLLIGSIATFMTLTFSEYDPEQTAQFWEQQYAAMGIEMPKDSHSWYLNYYSWLQQHYNILLMIGMPFLAYGTFKAFRKREMSYAQHLVMALYYYAIIVMINIPILPFSKFGDFSDGFNQLNFLIMPLWMGWVFKDYFKLSYIKGVLMAIWSYIISQLAMVAFSLVLGLAAGIIGFIIGYSSKFF